jgi:hypothetical protein
MPGWIFAGVLAVLAFFFSGDVYLWLLSGPLQHDRLGLVTVFVKAVLPYVNYAIGLFFVFVAYKLYERRKYRIMALIGDSPDCPRCGSIMRHRRARSGGSYWGCPDCRSRVNF